MHEFKMVGGAFIGLVVWNSNRGLGDDELDPELLKDEDFRLCLDTAHKIIGAEPEAASRNVQIWHLDDPEHPYVVAPRIYPY